MCFLDRVCWTLACDLLWDDRNHIPSAIELTLELPLVYSFEKSLKGLLTLVSAFVEYFGNSGIFFPPKIQRHQFDVYVRLFQKDLKNSNLSWSLVFFKSKPWILFAEYVVKSFKITHKTIADTTPSISQIPNILKSGVPRKHCNMNFMLV